MSLEIPVYLRIAAAILKRAFCDLQQEEHAAEARSWLQGDFASLAIYCLDLDPEQIPAAVARVAAGPRLTLSNWR